MKSKKKFSKFYKLTLVFLLAIVAGFMLAKGDIEQKGGESGSVQQPRIEISGVSVNDFVKDSNSEKVSFVTIDKTKDYHVFYIPSQELFYITITSYPFDDHIENAENALLDQLGINQNEACQLNVDVTTPAYANPEKAGVVYDLSWCVE